MKTNIQAQMKELFGNSCLAYVYAAFLTGSTDAKELTFIVLNGWRNGWVDDDGFVSKPVQYLNSFSSKKVKDIRKHNISSLKELPGIGDWPVEYKLTPDSKASHFVLATSKFIIFDPSGVSNTVKNGVPVSYREIVYE